MAFSRRSSAHDSARALWRIRRLIIYPLVVSSASYRLAVQLAVHKKAFKLISTQDGMTGLLHHAAWMERLNEIFLRCRTDEVVAVLALIDEWVGRLAERSAWPEQPVFSIKFM